MTPTFWRPGESAICKHCGRRIVLFNWALGPSWTHQHEDAAFHDGIHQFCQITRAEPNEEGE